jgi:hypothetical protein
MRVLFPFIRTFRQLDLRRHWWHRLCLVLFFLAVIVSPLWIWISLNRAEMEGFSHCLSIGYGHADRNSAQLCGELFPVHIRLNLLAGVVLTLFGFYLLQVAYRILIYVIFGRAPITLQR